MSMVKLVVFYLPSYLNGRVCALDHDVMFMRAAIDLDGAEGEIIKLHRRLLGKCGQASGALLRSDGGKRGPALLNVMAVTVWADNPAFLIVDER
jgi:hypothetical protein